MTGQMTRRTLLSISVAVCLRADADDDIANIKALVNTAAEALRNHEEKQFLGAFDPAMKGYKELAANVHGLLRDADGLGQAKRGLDALAAAMPKGLFRRAVEARNLHVVAELIVASALGREESRGAHYRNDFPLHDAVGKHSLMQKGRLEFAA